jgi:wyosine [tRNA(Phe)-imidazoG37] synthetase (radical SAM superfamily)
MSSRRVVSTTDHTTGREGLRYVYAVLSRRAGGVSVGINLNPNRACNFRCAYCQVEGLTRGAGPDIDLPLLEQELGTLLDDIDGGGWLDEHTPGGAHALASVAFSGDGEPTTSPVFAQAVDVVGRALRRRDTGADVELVVISNGSLAAREPVQRGLNRLAELGGEVWFKLDRGRDDDIKRVNDTALGIERTLDNLRACAAACPTKIQTCMFAFDGAPPADDEVDAWLSALARARDFEVPPRGVLLYGIERPSHQPEAPRLSKLSSDWLNALGERVRATGLPCEVSA